MKARQTLALLAATFAASVAAGLMVITATVLVVDTLRPGAEPGSDPRFYILMGGTLGGVVLAAVTAWTLLGAISSTYRRGGLAMVCGFATVVLMLICIPVNQLLGHTGLLTLLGLSGLCFALLARRTLKLRSQA
ncbi:MAG TPA: hypothetical protein VF252_13780 [Gemmatimonadales bacterium]